MRNNLGRNEKACSIALAALRIMDMNSANRSAHLEDPAQGTENRSDHSAHHPFKARGRAVATFRAATDQIVLASGQMLDLLEGWPRDGPMRSVTSTRSLAARIPCSGYFCLDLLPLPLPLSVSVLTVSKVMVSTGIMGKYFEAIFEQTLGRAKPPSRLTKFTAMISVPDGGGNHDGEPYGMMLADRMSSTVGWRRLDIYVP